MFHFSVEIFLIPLKNSVLYRYKSRKWKSNYCKKLNILTAHISIVGVKQKIPYNKFYSNGIKFNFNYNKYFYFTFNDISSYVYEDEKEIELCNDCQIMKGTNRTRTPGIEDYELSRHYCIGIQESFQASRVFFFNKIAAIAVKFPASYYGTLPLIHLSR